MDWISGVYSSWVDGTSQTSLTSIRISSGPEPNVSEGKELDSWIIEECTSRRIGPEYRDFKHYFLTFI